jgi:DNA-directed RNA polymerase I, II, and III subunit RPABC1
MADDDTAKLWKVNRTIHELVKDRVSQLGAHIL